MSVLDNPVWHALTGPQATVAEGNGRAVRFRRDVSVFGALPDDATPEDWDALRGLVGAAGHVFLARDEIAAPPGWTVVFRAEGTQMTTERRVTGAPADPPLAIERLDATAVPEILELVERTQPGPFLPRTIELGTYLGMRDGGALVALAGMRMHLPGWTEISAVCTDDAYRGRGLAKVLVGRLVDEILDRDERVCLHAVATNAPAIALYEALGFTICRSLEFAFLRAAQ